MRILNNFLIWQLKLSYEGIENIFRCFWHAYNIVMELGQAKPVTILNLIAKRCKNALRPFHRSRRAEKSCHWQHHLYLWTYILKDNNTVCIKYDTFERKKCITEECERRKKWKWTSPCLNLVRYIQITGKYGIFLITRKKYYFYFNDFYLYLSTIYDRIGRPYCHLQIICGN